MTNTEKMIDRVKKLLAKADTSRNPSEEEAKAALLMANKLIAKYNLDLSEEIGEKVEYSLLPATHPNNNGYRIPLANVIAPSFRCKVIMVGNTIHFFGRKEDAEACVEVYNYVYRVSRSLAQKLERQARKEGRSIHGLANSYWNGFVAGISKELSEQCKALMVVVPQDVNEEFAHRYQGCKRYKGGMRNTGYQHSAYQQGVQDGQHSMKNRKEIEG